MSMTRPKPTPPCSLHHLDGPSHPKVAIVAMVVLATTRASPLATSTVAKAATTNATTAMVVIIPITTLEVGATKGPKGSLVLPCSTLGQGLGSIPGWQTHLLRPACSTHGLACLPTTSARLHHRHSLPSPPKVHQHWHGIKNPSSPP